MPNAARLKVMLWATVKAVTIFTVLPKARSERQQGKQEQQMVDATDDVLDTEAEIEEEVAGRSAIGRSIAGYGDARLALPFLEDHLLGAPRPLDVGDRVMVDPEKGVAAVTDRKVAYGRAARIKPWRGRWSLPGARRRHRKRTAPATRGRSASRDVRSRQVTAIGPPFDPVAPLIGAGEKM
jgi:hypothetical protein